MSFFDPDEEENEAGQAAPKGALRLPWQKRRKDGETPTAASMIFDWLEVFVFALSFVLILFAFVGRIAIVVGPSMENTLIEKDTLIISNLFYEPKPGDIIVFQLPENPQFPDPIVKRVIATAGQTVDIDAESWIVYVDGEPIDEPYVKHAEAGSMREGNMSYPYTVREGEVFVMGDNRRHSTDSRYTDIGPVDVRYILGEVKLRVLPVAVFGPVK